MFVCNLFLSSPLALGKHFCFLLIEISLDLLKFYRNEIIEYICSCFAILPNDRMILRLIYFVCYSNSHFFYIPWHGYATICLSNHLLIDIWIVSSIFGLYEQSCYEHLCRSFYIDINAFIPFGSICRIKMAGYGRCIIKLNLINLNI